MTDLRTRTTILADLAEHVSRTAIPVDDYSFPTSFQELRATGLRLEDLPDRDLSIAVDLFSGETEPDPVPWLHVDLTLDCDDEGWTAAFHLPLSPDELGVLSSEEPPSELLLHSLRAVLANADGAECPFQVEFSEKGATLDYRLILLPQAPDTRVDALCSQALTQSEVHTQHARRIATAAYAAVQEQATGTAA